LKKHLNKHCTRAYKEIYVKIGEAFEAVPTNVNNNETCPSAETPEARPKKISELEVTKKPASSFTAKINELERQNLALMTELKQWRSTTSNVETLNRKLGTNLETAQLSVDALQQEKERMKKNCHQNAMAANFFRIKAVQADTTIKELFSAFESVKAKIPAVCLDSESLQARSHYKG
jgi:chromosome segregation ATPase